MPAGSTSISDLLNQIQLGEIVLPDLQRDFVWDQEQMRLFFDSVMRDYPFGSLLMWETQFHEVLFRDFVRDYKSGMTFSPKAKEKGRRKKMVLDGQQRLQTLYVGAYGSIDGRRLYFNMTSGPGEFDDDSDSPLGSYRRRIGTERVFVFGRLKTLTEGAIVDGLQRDRDATNSSGASQALLRASKVFSQSSPILDLGCGTGRNAIALAQLGMRVVCVDKDQKRVQALKRTIASLGLSKTIAILCAEAAMT
jgi:Protein of unknown function DUF262/Methyltransferase domain